MSQITLVEQASDVPQPAAGELAIYAKDDHTVYKRDGDTGDVVPLGGLSAADQALFDLLKTAGKAPVRAATTANITLSGEQSIDGLALVTGNRCLVKNQSSTQENGVYVVDSGAWTRAIDFDALAEIALGTVVPVGSGGTDNGNTYWMVTTLPATLGTNPLAFTAVGFSSTQPNDVVEGSGAGTPGTSPRYAAADHTHSHGGGHNDPTAHTGASASAGGFMSALDFITLRDLGFTVKPTCRVATTANIASLSGLLTVDGVTVADGDRVLVKNQSTASENGIYIAHSSAWDRASDFDTDVDAVAGSLIPVLAGTTNRRSTWMHTTTGAVTLGSTALTFSRHPLVTAVEAEFAIPGSLFVAAITADTNNYAGFDTVSTVGVLSPDANPRTLTGIANGTAGRILLMENGSSANSLVLAHESTSSTAANRISSPSGEDIVVGPLQAALLFYDSTASRWKVVANHRSDPVVDRRVIPMAATGDANNADFPVSVPASLAADSNDAGFLVALFDDTAEEGRFWDTVAPAGTRRTRYRVRFRAETTPAGARTAALKVYKRAILNGATFDSVTPADLSVSADEEWRWVTFTIDHATWTTDISPGEPYQFVVTRVAPGAGTDLEGDLAVALIIQEWLA